MLGGEMAGANHACIFCRVVRNPTSTHLLHTDEKVVAFQDIKPAARSYLSMGDTQGKSKNTYIPWSVQETKTLLRLLVDGVNQNWTDGNCTFSKLTVEQRILPELNRICGSTKTYPQFKNRTKILKGRYKSFADLLRFSSGFGWDSETKKFTAPQEIWEEYFKGHPKDKHLRDDTFEDFEDLQKIYGQNIAKGNNAVGLGDTTDARTYGARDHGWENQGGYTPQRIGGDIDDDDDDDDDDDNGVEQVSSSLRRNANEKLPIRKKARTEAYNVEKFSDEIFENVCRSHGCV